MLTADDREDERPSRLTHVIYNATLGHLRVRAEDGLATTVEVPPGEVRFRRVLGAVEPEAALWLDSVEQQYLARMLQHVLGTLKITPEARTALEAVRTKLAELAAPPLEDDEQAEAAQGAGPPLVDEAPAAPPPVAPPRAAAPPAVADAAAATAAPPPQAAEGPRRRSRSRPAPRMAAPEQAAAPTADRPDTAPPGPPATAGTVPELDVAAAAPPRGAASGGRPASDRSGAGEAGELAATEGEVAEPPFGPIPFETVWQDLQALRAKRSVLQALAGQASSEIRDVTDEGVWLYSHGIGRTYLVRRELLESAWAILLEAGRLVPRELRMSYGAVTLLAHLPYVEYTAEPVTLYFPTTTMHPLGTVHRREAES